MQNRSGGGGGKSLPLDVSSLDQVTRELILVGLLGSDPGMLRVRAHYLHEAECLTQKLKGSSPTIEVEVMSRLAVDEWLVARLTTQQYATTVGQNGQIKTLDCLQRVISRSHRRLRGALRTLNVLKNTQLELTVIGAKRCG
jgi:hypothetical protein